MSYVTHIQKNMHRKIHLCNLLLFLGTELFDSSVLIWLLNVLYTRIIRLIYAD